MTCFSVAHFLSKINTLKRTLPLLAAHQSILLAVSYFLTGSWTFLRTYSAMVAVEDLTPNIGLYWYIFIEMFEHFRNFFLLVFQAHLVCYAVPICMKLQYAQQTSSKTSKLSLPISRFDPLLAFTVLTGIQATFKSYPTLGDMALYHALLALFPELVPRKFAESLRSATAETAITRHAPSYVYHYGPPVHATPPPDIPPSLALRWIWEQQLLLRLDFGVGVSERLRYSRHPHSRTQAQIPARAER